MEFIYVSINCVVFISLGFAHIKCSNNINCNCLSTTEIGILVFWDRNSCLHQTKCRNFNCCSALAQVQVGVCPYRKWPLWCEWIRHQESTVAALIHLDWAWNLTCTPNPVQRNTLGNDLNEIIFKHKTAAFIDQTYRNRHLRQLERCSQLRLMSQIHRPRWT